MKVLMCFGTRPEAIKMAPLYIYLKSRQTLELKLCVTAQHRQMLDQVLDFFEIIPDFDLDLMQKNQSLNQLASKIIYSIDEVLVNFQPEYVLVHGDTTTSSMVALAAFHRGIKVGHVEAGLRTYNKLSPFPEEINRQITGRIADLHFAPTIWSGQNLLNEGVKSEEMVVTGNTVIDALNLGLEKIKNGYTCLDIERLNDIIIPNAKIILITGHRRENFGDGFENLCNAIKQIATDFHDVQIIYPVHLNPNVQEPVNRILSNLKNVFLISPLDYPSFIYAMDQSYFILTDSGGVQEEAPTLGKPVLVMRNNTERPEAVKAGTVKLVGTNYESIVNACKELLLNNEAYLKMSRSHNPYGDGFACERIYNKLIFPK
ncbi:non-hydrolyzing UDP-N-acetylglucosamine 2-epimerase [Polluticaenibacter yanchengensis]|uniref:UDP-N-acetylglucosamine 2-epimerase (non-hydrolyzing) n=1 Tax=Polluticaenibacter yanchengensis TaxID=3014562 RepID=A0ABT4UHL7_9BACT|nr:UDP-N-acetylglucosamine 2-epimerase (non-hydrolyzing) [Chitinophagaceae bacterium LY-5]